MSENYQSELASAAESTLGSTTASSSSQRILIVEDLEDSRTSLQALFKMALDIEVDTAENEAPSSAERNRPFSVATRTMSLGVLVSTLRSRTEIVVPSSTVDPQLTPPFFDLVTAPPIKSWSYGSPRPR